MSLQMSAQNCTVSLRRRIRPNTEIAWRFASSSVNLSRKVSGVSPSNRSSARRAELQAKGDYAVAVHETRKALKRLRALLRLVRPAIGEDAFKRENAQLREIGLSLSGARDRHVLLETVNKLEGAPGLARKGLVSGLRASIAAANGEGAPLTMKEAQARLDEAKDPSRRAARRGQRLRCRRRRPRTVVSQGVPHVSRSLRQADRRSLPRMAQRRPGPLAADDAAGTRLARISRRARE